MVAPTGARRSKADHPALPMSLSEIIKEAVACNKEGADALHLHIRDEAGAHSLDPARYKVALDALHEAMPEMRVQITTESAGVFGVAEQLSCLETLVPGWASVSVREIARAPQLAERLYHGCAERGTELQHILYDVRDLTQLQKWLADGTILPQQTSVIIVLGRYDGTHDASPADLDPFLQANKTGMDWMACAFGPKEHACLAAAAARGGSLRVGFENSLTRSDGTPHASNATSVARLIRHLKGVTT